jgi:hypothetical protein
MTKADIAKDFILDKFKLLENLYNNKFRTNNNECNDFCDEHDFNCDD